MLTSTPSSKNFKSGTVLVKPNYITSASLAYYVYDELLYYICGIKKFESILDEIDFILCQVEK